MLALDVPGLTRSSDAVVRAKVTKVSSRWVKGGGRIVTDIEFSVLEAWKGASAASVKVTQPGGEVGDIGQRVDGVASFVPGEEVVVFLEARGPRFTMAGMAQGRFKVERSSDGRSTLVRQDQCGELHLVDGATRQETSQAPIALTLEGLKQAVTAAAAGAPRPSPTTAPGPSGEPRVAP